MDWIILSYNVFNQHCSVLQLFIWLTWKTVWKNHLVPVATCDFRHVCFCTVQAHKWRGVEKWGDWETSLYYDDSSIYWRFSPPRYSAQPPVRANKQSRCELHSDNEGRNKQSKAKSQRCESVWNCRQPEVAESRRKIRLRTHGSVDTGLFCILQIIARSPGCYITGFIRILIKMSTTTKQSRSRLEEETDWSCTDSSRTGSQVSIFILIKLKSASVLLFVFWRPNFNLEAASPLESSTFPAVHVGRYTLN